MLDLIKSRKSVRKYSEKHISDEDLRKILEAGCLPGLRRHPAV